MENTTFTRENIIDRLCGAGFAAYVTGGAVRDFLAGKPGHDEDIVTNAKPDEIAHLFKDQVVKFVGKSFPVASINGIDVATFRKDRHGGIGDKNCTFEFADKLEEDLSRRDLTINTLTWCQFTGDVIDLFGGREDLEKKIIRFVGNPAERIHQDPNRIIRACRFLAKFEGEFAPETFEALKNHRFLVRDHVDPERIRVEILKALELPKPSIFFQALADIGVLEFIFPDLVETIGHDHGKHHREDVWTHSLIVGDAISPKFPLLRLAGFLHDVGKPEAWKKGNDGKFIGHEKDGARIAKRLLSALRFSLEEIEIVTNFIAVHMLPIGHLGPKGFRSLFAKLSDHGVTLNEFLRLRIADRIGNLAKDNLTVSDVKDIIKKFNRALAGKNAPSVKNLAVNGNDIQEVLGIRPGPKVGFVLRQLFEFVLDVGFEFNTDLVLRAKIHEFKD